MFRLLVLALAVCVSASSFGFGQVSARVLSVRIDQDGRGMVLFDQPVSGEPATCRDSAYANALAFDANTPGGKAIMDLALATKANGFALYAVGLGTCNIYGGNGAEDWDYGVMQ
jgi:hypothetical protein